jgi:hypothetical protein
MTKEKKFLSFFLIFVVSFFFIKISITKISYIFISKYAFNDFIISKNLDERVIKMMLLKKSNINFDTYFFGTSTATAYYPNDLKKLNINSFNVSFSAGNVSEHLTYLNWILKNKLTPKRIYLELRDHSLLDINYKVSMHPDLLSFFLKAKFYLVDFSTFKFVIKSFISYDELIFKTKKIAEKENIIKENEKRKLNYVLTGARYYQSYFDRKDNRNLQEANEKNIINDNFIYLDYEIDDNKMNDLKKISEICALNNIDCKFFFGPVYKNLLIRDESEYLIRELNIIEQIFKRDIADKIYYFNNSDYSQNIKNFEKDQIHYNYDTAFKIAEELIKNNGENINNLFIFNAYNLQNYKKKFIN